MEAVRDVLASLWDEYAKATADFASAKQGSELADHNYALALDRLNKAQSELDSAFAELRLQAPEESRWQQRETLEKRRLADEQLYPQYRRQP